MKHFLVMILLVLLMLPCLGQSNDLTFRKAYNLKLAVNDTNFFSVDVPETPYIQPENTVQIYPGEMLFVEVEINRDSITAMI